MALDTHAFTPGTSRGWAQGHSYWCDFGKLLIELFSGDELPRRASNGFLKQKVNI